MQREPVRRAVMLLGWSGSKLRHVRKHEACWPSGTAVFAENVTIEDTFARSGRAALREKARRLVAVESRPSRGPVCGHGQGWERRNFPGQCLGGV